MWFHGQTRHPRGDAEGGEGDRGEPWFKTLLVSMKWKLRKAYKLELNDEEKTTLEINSVRKESKDML